MCDVRQFLSFFFRLFIRRVNRLDFSPLSFLLSLLCDNQLVHVIRKRTNVMISPFAMNHAEWSRTRATTCLSARHLLEFVSDVTSRAARCCSDSNLSQTGSSGISSSLSELSIIGAYSTCHWTVFVLVDTDPSAILGGLSFLRLLCSSDSSQCFEHPSVNYRRAGCHLPQDSLRVSVHSENIYSTRTINYSWRSDLWNTPID